MSNIAQDNLSAKLKKNREKRKHHSGIPLIPYPEEVNDEVQTDVKKDEKIDKVENTQKDEVKVEDTQKDEVKVEEAKKDGEVKVEDTQKDDVKVEEAKKDGEVKVEDKKDDVKPSGIRSFLYKKLIGWWWK